MSTVPTSVVVVDCYVSDNTTTAKVLTEHISSIACELAKMREARR